MSTRTPQEAVKAACALIGGQRPLARALGITQQTIRGWIAGDAPVPAKQAARIEHLTAGAVPAFETCPSVPWHLQIAKPVPAHLQAAIALCRDQGDARIKALCDAYEAGFGGKTPKFLREFVEKADPSVQAGAANMARKIDDDIYRSGLRPPTIP